MFQWIKKTTAFILLVIFSLTQSGWSAESIQMIDGQLQPVSDPFSSEIATKQLPSEPVDFLADEGPLSLPEVPALPPARVSFSSTAGLTATSVTTLPGTPRPYLAAGTTAATVIQNPTSNLIQLNYSADSPSEFSGFDVSFDNASTSVVETRSITALSYLTLGLKGEVATVRLQVEDVNGVKDEIDLAGVSSVTEKFWRIPITSLSSLLDKSKIKFIRFLVSPANASISSGTGKLFVRANGLNLSAPAVPVVTVPVFTNQSPLTLSGTKEAHTSVLVNGVEVVGRNESTTWTIQLPLAVEGMNTFYVIAKNTLGKASGVKTLSITKDTVIPTGGININSGAAYVRSRTVTLNLSARDNKSGIAKMSFSIDGKNWSAPEVYRTSKSFLLPDGDGAKTVYVKYFDRAGNESASYFKSIVLDLLPPSGTMRVGDGSGFVNSRNVVLNLNAQDLGVGVSKMSFSHNGSTWTTAENYAQTKNWILAAGDGAKKVYARFLDKAGRWSVPVLVNVMLDSVKPAGAININFGDVYARSNSVTLNLSASDVGGGIGGMSFSTDGSIWSAPENYSASKSFVLPDGDGTKTVFVKYFDKAGNASAVYSKSIHLDTVAPEAGVILFDGKTVTRELSGSAAFSASDSGSGLEAVRYSLDQGATWREWGGFISQRSIDLPAGDGRKEIIYEARDAAGNISSITRSITVDQTAPILEVLTSASVVRVGVWVVEYLSDGVLKTKSYQLNSGTNALNLSETDEAGNTSSLSFNVEYEREWDIVLENGALQHFEEGILKYEISLETPAEERGETDETQAVEMFAAPPSEEMAAAATNSLPAIHVYSGDDLQAAIDGAQFGQTVLLHTGSYLGHFVLKAGVSLIGENRDTVILHGNFETNKDVITAMGNNRIENLTVTGGGKYYWGPSSAINVQGDHVQILSSKISGNKDYGIYISADVSDVVIENNLIRGNNVGVQLPKNGNQIRFNTLVQNSIAVNILNGTSPIVENNIIADNTYQSIYEFGWGLVPTNGRAVVRNNTVFNNPEKGGAYGLNLPPAMETRDGTNWSQGNVLQNPQFVNPVAGDFSVQFGSPAFSRGAFVPEAWEKAAARSAQFNLASVIQEVKVNNVTAGYRVVYPAGTIETFMNDGTETLDTAGPVIEISTQNPKLVNQAEYDLVFTVDGSPQTKRFTLTEGDNLFTIEASDELGNRTVRELAVYRVISDPQPIVLSVGTASSSEYLLSYQVSDTEFSEKWQLHPGSNQLVFQVIKNGKPFYFKHEVVLNQPDPSEPLFPSKANLASDSTSVQSADGHTYFYESGVLKAIQKLGQYDLRDIALDAAGNLQAGTLYFDDGRVALYQNGKIVFEKNQQGEIFYYSSDGRLQIIQSGQNKTYLSYQLNSEGQVAKVLVSNEDGSGLYGADSKPHWIDQNETIELSFSSGKLISAKAGDGAEFQYEIRNQVDGFGEQSLLKYVKSVVGVWLTRDGLLGDAAQKQFWAAQYPDVPVDVLYASDLDVESAVNLRGDQFRFSLGLPLSVSFSGGQVLNFFSSSDQGFKLGVQSQAPTSVIEQVYDSEGNLTAIRLADGSVLNVQNGALEKIVLADGSFIDEIERFNGQLYKYRYTYPDGSIDWIENYNQIGKRREKDGSERTYYYDSALHSTVNNQYTSPDGRVYRVSLVQNAAGQFDEVYELQRINFEDGSYLEMENGKPKRYVRQVEEPLEESEYPVLPANEAYIPYVEINGHQFRSLRIDSLGNILAGEIFFNDGTQYLLENGKLKTQVTPNGQVIHFDAPVQPVPPQVAEPIAALSAAEVGYHNDLIEVQLDYFVNGIGLDSDTGLPLDNYRISPTSDKPNRLYSQATLIGFWAEILTAIATGDYVTSRMTQSDALNRLNQLLATYRQVQQQIGWNGFVSFFDIVKEQKPILDTFGEPTGQTELVISYKNSFDHYGFGDALNLALSLATVVGAFKNREMGALNTLRDQIVAGGESILAAQEPGYAAFYHSGEKRFQHTYKKNTSGQWVMEGLMDRMMNEFRPGMMWLLATHPQYRETLLKLDLSIKSYVAQNGEVIENAAPWDGGAFQMFWPLIHIDETQYSEFAVVHRNFLKSQQDYVLANGIAGLLSAGARPGAEYEGKMGLKDTAETDDPLIQDTGSFYGLAGAYAIAPHYTLQFFKNIENYLGNGLRTSAGLVDAVRIDEREVIDPVTGEQTTVRIPVFSDIFYGVDQGSLILSMLGTSQNYFSNYLGSVQAQDDLDLLYESVQFNLKPAENNLMAPPDFGESSPLLYDGAAVSPDGTSPALIRKPALISTVSDPDFGMGEVYEYLTPSGNFHHLEIEFQEGSKKLNLREYADMPGRRGIAKAFLEKEIYSLFDSASQWGAFYSGMGSAICPQGDCGFASGAFSYDPEVGETMRFAFDFKRVDRPIGLWAKFLTPLDMSAYDMVTVPVKVRDPALANQTRLKFELKGVGEIYVSPLLTADWQYLQIPVRKTNPVLGSLQMRELAIVLLSESGAPIQGQIELGAISAMKIRHDSNINLQQITGFYDAQLRSFLINKGKEHIGLPGKVTREEVLEDFEIDSAGKLIRGVLKKANGEVQFYDRGLLRKWTFLNGRTVTFAENGLAEFVIDLSKGQLDISRFYFDQSFAGKIYSFIIQENDRKRIFNQQGQLTEMIEGGRRILFRDGAVSEIQSDIGVLTDLEFASDGALLAATATLAGGAVHRIVRGAENTIDFSNGVKVTYRNDLAIRAERVDGAVTTFEYIQNPDGVIVSAKALWQENGAAKEMILGEFLDQPSRALEKAVLTDATRDVLTAKPGVFTLGTFLQGEFMNTYAQGEAMQNGQTCSAKYCWVYKYNSINGPIMGIVMSTTPTVMNLNDYDFMYARLRHSAQTSDQDHQIRIQTFNYATQGLFLIDGVGSDFKSYSFGISNNAQSSTQVTIEMTGRLPEALSVYNELDLAALQYVDLKKNDEAFTQLISWSPQELRRVWNESNALKKVGGHIANKQSLVFSQLAATFDAPARLVYQPQNNSERTVSEIRRVDGTELAITNGQVNTVRMLDGTVHEYDAPTENAAAIQVRGVTEDAAAIEYQYGALRKIRQTDGHVYSLSYEFDSQGKEIVVLKDDALGEVRRFQDGKLMEAQSDDEVKTSYTYQDGELKGADVFYQNRVLRSTEYQYINDETLVKDDEGTTWYYDKDGKLRKHLTKDGYLYSHVDYSFDNAETLFPFGDYKHKIETATGLKAVVLDGYETEQYQILYDKGPEAEIRFRNGDQAVRLQFDAEYSIKSGYAQLQLGEVFQITDYVPVSGRYADGEEFAVSFPADAQDYALLQNNDGSLQGFEFSIGAFRYTYNVDGQLIKVVDGSGSNHVFSYTPDSVTGVITYTDQYSKQLDFNGVPFPAEMELVKENDQMLMKVKGAPLVAEGETALEKGFVAAIFDEALNEWKKIQGTFHSDGDRIRLRQMLEGMKAGQSFAMMVHGDVEFYRADETLLALLEGVGAGQVRQAAAQNKNWFFFGNESLSAGQGREKVDGDSLSTLVKTQIAGTLGSAQIQTSIASIASNVRMLISRDARYLQLLSRYSEFLKNYSPYRPKPEIQSATVYDANGDIVFTERMDGLRSHYEEGQVKETFTAEGELLYSYEYGCPAAGCGDNKKVLTRVNLVKARSEFEAEAIRMREQIEKIKFDALYDLAQQNEVANAEIKQQVTEAYDQYTAQINDLQRQQFQDVKVCGRKWWGGKSCKHYTVEVPGVREAISRLSAERAQLYQVEAEQIATIPGVIRAKQDEIEASIAGRLSDLSEQEREVALDLLEKEIAPVVADLYRRALGRDPSAEEVRALAVEFEVDKKINYNVVSARILNGAEHQARSAGKEFMIAQVESFLDQFLDAKDTGDTAIQTQLLATLALQASDTVDLKRADVETIVAWLKSRDLHFGQSAFLSLQKMLASRGVQVEMKILGWQSMVIDILAGALTKFEEGDLLLSMFALSKTAQIHGADVKAVRYNQTDLIELYQTECPQGPLGCNVQAIIHIGGDHFAVVTYASANEVRYFETNKGVNGEEQKITMTQFMEVWNTGDGTGHMLVFGDHAKAENVLTREQSLRVRGADIFTLIFAVFAWASVALTATSLVVSFFSPKWGRILGFAAMVAGIAAIVTAVANFVVSAANTALGSLSNGIFNAVKQGFQSIGTTIWESVKSVGRYVLNGFKFIKNALTGNLGSLGGFKIANVGSFVKEGIQLVYSPVTGEFATVGKLSLGQKIARMTISAGLEYGVSKGLQGMGIDSRIAGLAGAFIGGGVQGLGVKGASFYKSGLQRFMLQQVSEIGLHLGLAPPIIKGITSATQFSLTQAFGLSGNELTNPSALSLFPEFSQNISTGTIEMLARSFGLDPRLASFLSAPLGSLVSGVTMGLFNPTGNIFNSIKASLLNKDTLIQSISLGAGALGSNASAGFTSGAIMGAVSAMMGNPSFFTNVGNLLKNILLNPTGLIQSAISSVQNLFQKVNEAIQSKGIVGAVSDWITKMFERKTQEEINQAGGIDGFLSGSGTSTTFDGQSAREYKIGNGTSLFFNALNQMIGKTENGTTQSGEFGLNSKGVFGLITGKIVANLLGGGYTFAAEIQDGGVKTIDVKDQLGTAVVRGVGTDRSGIDIDIPDDLNNPPQNQSQTQTSFNWSNFVMDLAQAGIALSFGKDGKLNQVTQTYSTPTVATKTTTTSTKPFYLLSNGLNNEEKNLLNIFRNQDIVPGYYRAAEDDLFNASGKQVSKEEILTPSTFLNFLFLRLFGNALNRTKDVLWWAAESQIPGARALVVNDIEDAIRDFYAERKQNGEDATLRPMVGVGYSGGLAPLLETIGRMKMPLAGIVGAGSATADIAEVRETLELLGNALEYAQRNALAPVRGVLNLLFGWIPVVGDLAKRVITVLFDKLDLIFVPGAVLTDLLWKEMENAVRLTLEETGVQAKMRDFKYAGLAETPTAGTTFVNVYGDMDVLNTLRVGGYRDHIGSFTTTNDSLINIEVMSRTDASGKVIAQADHYIYFRNTRSDSDYTEFGVNEQNQRDFDKKVYEFMTQLTLRNRSSADAQQFLVDYVNYLEPQIDGSYKYYPYGRP